MSLMKFSILLGRMAYFFDEHIDQTAAGRIADFGSDFFDRRLCSSLLSGWHQKIFKDREAGKSSSEKVFEGIGDQSIFLGCRNPVDHAEWNILCNRNHSSVSANEICHWHH